MLSYFTWFSFVFPSTLRERLCEAEQLELLLATFFLFINVKMCVCEKFSTLRVKIFSCVWNFVVVIFTEGECENICSLVFLYFCLNVHYFPTWDASSGRSWLAFDAHRLELKFSSVFSAEFLLFWGKQNRKNRMGTNTFECMHKSEIRGFLEIIVGSALFTWQRWRSKRVTKIHFSKWEYENRKGAGVVRYTLFVKHLFLTTFSVNNNSFGVFWIFYNVKYFSDYNIVVNLQREFEMN